MLLVGLVVKEVDGGASMEGSGTSGAVANESGTGAFLGLLCMGDLGGEGGVLEEERWWGRVFWRTGEMKMRMRRWRRRRLGIRVNGERKLKVAMASVIARVVYSRSSVPLVKLRRLGGN